METPIPKQDEKTTVIKVPEAVGVFDSFESLQNAFYDLRMVGFSRYDISLLGSQEALEEKLGKAYWRASELEDDPKAPEPPLSPRKQLVNLRVQSQVGFSSSDLT